MSRDRTSGGLADVAHGFVYPLRGVQFLFAHAPLRRLALWPAFLAAAGVAAVMALSFLYADELVGLWWARPDVWWKAALWYLAVASLFISLVLAGVAVVPPLAAAPFQEPLSREAERLAAGSDGGRERGLIASVVVGVADQLARTVVLVGGYALIFAVWVVPVVGGPLSSLLSFAWTAVWAAADNLDVPMSRHRYRFRDLWALFRARRGLVLGFGAGTALLLMVPVLNFVAAQGAVVAATLLFLSLRNEGVLPPEEPAGADSPRAARA